jgi:hypothetical protein
MGFESDVFGMLRYFDALSDDFYHNFFTYYVPDNEYFSRKEVQQMLITEILKGNSFRLWHGVSDHDEFYSNGIGMKYKIADDTIFYLTITTKNMVYERKLINNQ